MSDESTQRKSPGRATRTLEWLKQPKDRLQGRTAHASVWAVALRFSDRGLLMIRTIVLARLLTPEDFGVMGVAVLTLTLVETLSKTGFRSALIQRRDEVDKYLDVAWTVELLRSIFLAGVMVLAAPWIARFFGTPEATGVVRVVAITFVLEGIQNIGTMYFEKDLEFHKRFVLLGGNTLVNLVVSIVAAVMMRSVWALVIGSLAGSLYTTVASYWLHPHRPRLAWRRQRAGELFSYGRWVFLSSILRYVNLNLDDIIVGRVLGVDALGRYRVAYNVSQAPATELSVVVGSVMFPAFSAVQDRPAALRRGFDATLQLVAVFSTPIAIGIVVLGPAFVSVVLGEQWVAISTTLQLLGIWGLLRAVGASTGPLFMALGRPRTNTLLLGIEGVLVAATLYPLVNCWGTEGAAFSTIIGAVVTVPLAVRLCCNLVGYRLRTFLVTVSLPLLASGVAAAAFYGMEAAGVEAGDSLAAFLADGFVFALVYGAVSALFELVGWYRLRTIVGGALRSGDGSVVEG
ncbi:MAG: hypothetical protein JJLCMIEE_02324 [Acidimicrobiales bacterium]|nr:hypothetical protein [Acidimicrobiales bacterium]